MPHCAKYVPTSCLYDGVCVTGRSVGECDVGRCVGAAVSGGVGGVGRLVGDAEGGAGDCVADAQAGDQVDWALHQSEPTLQ